LTLVADLPDEVLGWTREAPDERLLLIANMSDEEATADAVAVAAAGEVLVGTSSRHGSVGLRDLRLAPLEGLLLRL
jgi:hypothetical protein